MRKFFFYLAAGGWVISFIVHLLSFAGIDVAARIPAIWLLHIGIFLVWLPAILFLRRNRRFTQGTYNRGFALNPVSYVKLLFGNIPRPLLVIGIFGFFYAFVNFLVVMIPMHGTPDIKDGHYILESKGQLIRTLTETEYHSLRAQILRGFSGHWLAFYGLAMCFLYGPAFPSSPPAGEKDPVLRP
jgi:hypothetical protein